MEDASPFTLAGRYEVKERISLGRAAVVYRAVDLRLGRTVALKVLRAPLAHQERLIRRFEREAKAIAQLSHPNLVQIFDYGLAAVENEGQAPFAPRGVWDRDDGLLLPFIVLEYIWGTDLRHEIKAVGQFPVDRAVPIMRSCALGLGAMHRQGIVHRAVKPSVILIGDDGGAKLVGFGSARNIDAVDVTVTAVGGDNFDSVNYLSPEQCLGEIGGPPADIYALGAIMYELLTGHAPHAVDESAMIDTLMMFIDRKVRGTVQPIGEYQRGVPAKLEETVLKCLSRNPKERYQDGDELANALGQIPLAVPRVFVSYSHQDKLFCQAYVVGLRGRGVQVWFDRQEGIRGPLRRDIEIAMGSCDHYIGILSPDAVESDWVNEEIDAARALMRDGKLRTIMFVVARRCTIPLLLERYRRIEGHDGGAVLVEEAVSRTLVAIGSEPQN